MKKYIALFFISLIYISVQAKENPIQGRIPSENLTFLMYYNAAHIAKHQNIEKELSQKIQEAHQYIDDVMVYTHSVDTFHVMLTVRFNLREEIAPQKIKDWVLESGLTITKEEGPFINLEQKKDDKGRQSRFGFLHQGEDFWTFKLLYKQGFINAEYNALSEKKIEKIYTEEISYTEFINYTDSLYQLDLPKVKPFVDTVLEKEKQDILQSQKLKKGVEFPQELNHLPVVTYFNDQTFIQIAAILGYNESLLDIFFKNKAKEHLEIFEPFNQAGKGEEIWYGVDVNEKEINITSLTSQKTPSKIVKIDHDILQYFPSDATSWMIYGFDVEWLRRKLIQHLDLKPRRKDGELKLKVLTLDDDFLKVFQTGFLAVSKGNKTSSSSLNFKVAFKMPNAEKGRLLLQTFSYEMDYLRKINDNTYFVIHNKFDDEPTYLVIEDDIWIFGVGSPETLRQKNKNVLQQHPELSNSKTNMIMDVDDQTFGGSSVFERIYSTSEHLSKKKLSTKTIIKIKERPN
ncbi:hypothetical protein [Flammeovirga sp. SJP92]|uniref:hypothetical protein n=1 Tax=Flammeovirga sp. SJP92 TaxID=1775430 RepID=UPI0007950D7E|nr:hypothetical protein [Flammeovirga sp. SJP92]KXX66780.1 hypothetical protein AVL50_30065 [Flammeovirga sp. SJP92]